MRFDQHYFHLYILDREGPFIIRVRESRVQSNTYALALELAALFGEIVPMQPLHALGAAE